MLSPHYLAFQIYYRDTHDTNGFVIKHNHNDIMQCSTMTHTNHSVSKTNTCHTSAVAFFMTNDTVEVADLGHQRQVILDKGKSFFGLVKLTSLTQPLSKNHQNGVRDSSTMDPNFS